jgi:hypothetical protein
MLGKFYKGYHVIGAGVYARESGRWTSKVNIYPPLGISLRPTSLTSGEGLFVTEAEAEQEGVRMGKNWVDRQPSWRYTRPI